MMVSGASAHYVSSGPAHLGLPKSDGPYRKAHDPRPPRATGIDFDALAPSCKGCGQKSGTVSFTTGLCRTCDPATQKPTPAPAKATARRRPAAAPHLSDPEPIAEPTAVAQPEVTDTLVDRLQAWAQRLRDLEADLSTILEAAGLPTAAAVDARTTAAAPRAARRRPSAGQGHGKPVDEAAVVLEYQGGDTAPAIAKRHGVLAKRIRNILDRNGVERRDDRPRASGGRNAKALEAYDPDQVRTIVERYSGGEAMQDIAADLHCSSTFVRDILRKAEVEVRPPAHMARATVLDEAQTAEIARRYAAGETSLSIARDFHIRADRVREAAKAAGVPIRPRGGQPRSAVQVGAQIRDVKVWGVSQGLIPEVRRGRAPSWLIEAYAAAHPAVLNPGSPLVDAEVTDNDDGQEASA